MVPASGTNGFTFIPIGTMSAAELPPEADKPIEKDKQGNPRAREVGCGEEESVGGGKPGGIERQRVRGELGRPAANLPAGIHI